jgi:hypothetical protein
VLAHRFDHLSVGHSPSVGAYDQRRPIVLQLEPRIRHRPDRLTADGSRRRLTPLPSRGPRGPRAATDRMFHRIPANGARLVHQQG